MKFKKIDRVKHPAMTSWGIGQVLEDASGDTVRVFFVGAGEKKLSLAHVQLEIVSGSAAASALLDNLRIHQGGGGLHFKSLSESIQFFLSKYPNGFHGERLQEEERNYKIEAHELANELLAAGHLRQLIDDEDLDGAYSRAMRVVDKTNLIFPNEKMQLKDGLRATDHKRLFAESLWNLLYSDEKPFEQRFVSFADMLEAIDAAKWTIATYFPFIVFPQRHMFLKPEVTQAAAELCGFEISYRSELNWHTYERLLAFGGWLFDELTKAKLQPRDMIDIQSFIWCIGPRKHK